MQNLALKINKREICEGKGAEKPAILKVQQVARVVNWLKLVGWN
jgi:hypothetical protein